MAMIQVKLWAGENSAGTKHYSNTPGDQIIALMEAEEWVCNSQRCAHIIVAGTASGIYIVRHTDEQKEPIWQARLEILREKLAKMERGY